MNDWIYFEKKIIFTKHKYVNLQIGWDKNSTNFYNFDIGHSHKTDHSGFHLNFGLLNFYFIFYTYDNRHWCEKCQKYMTDKCYGEE